MAEEPLNTHRALTAMSSVTVHVALLSGEQTTIVLPWLATIEELRQMAQEEVSKSLGKLVSSSGAVLLPSDTLQQAGVQAYDVITAVVRDVVIAATKHAFAAILSSGTVVAWGARHAGGDCSAVQHQLQNVQQIQSSAFAFAALLADGSVVTWGRQDSGGDSSMVQAQLHSVCQIQANLRAFAAIKADGSVVTWGDPWSGGDCGAVRDQLHDVQQIQATNGAFAAIRTGRQVVTWGQRTFGGDSSKVRNSLQDILQVYDAGWGFAAIKAGGRVVFWGLTGDGEQSTGLDIIDFFQAGGNYWAAATKDGHLALSFESVSGHGCMLVPDGAGAAGMMRLDTAIAVVQPDGTVRLWGHSIPKWLSSGLRNVVRLQAASAWGPYAAIRSDGSVVTWDQDFKQAASKAVQAQLIDVRSIQATENAFAALRGDGSVVTWGQADWGGDSDAVQGQLKDVVSLQATCGAFAAVRSDGSVVTWGFPSSGGDSRACEWGRPKKPSKQIPRVKPLAKTARANAKSVVKRPSKRSRV